MIEIELKFQIEPKDVKRIIELLRKAGYFITHERTYEKTAMYDNPKGLMQETNGRIRLRTSNDKCELCYKRPLARKRIKKEIEYEVAVSDSLLTEKILEMMEFTPATSYERYRTTLNGKDGKVKVTFDEYPFASFVEIEGKEKEIKSLASRLGLSLKDNLLDPCDTLFQKWRKRRGLPFSPHMLFNTYDK